MNHLPSLHLVHMCFSCMFFLNLHRFDHLLRALAGLVDLNGGARLPGPPTLPDGQGQNMACPRLEIDSPKIKLVFGTLDGTFFGGIQPRILESVLSPLAILENGILHSGNPVFSVPVWIVAVEIAALQQKYCQSQNYVSSFDQHTMTMSPLRRMEKCLRCFSSSAWVFLSK